jgi:hypothetical protein
MITKDELNEVISNLGDIGVMDNHILVLVPVPSETTDSGIIKGDTQLESEQSELEAFMNVILVGENVTAIHPHDRVFTQGQVVAFTENSNVPELDIAPEGYAIGLVATPYVKMFIKG